MNKVNPDARNVHPATQQVQLVSINRVTFVKQCPPGMYELNHVLRGTYTVNNGSTFCFDIAMRSLKNHYVHNVRSVIIFAMKIIPHVYVMMAMFFLKMGTAASNVHFCKRMLMEK